MNSQDLEIKTAIQVQKNVHEVFEAITDPKKMINYFISESNGRMETGKELLWTFPEFDMKVPIRVSNVEKDKYISFYWDGGGKELLAAITLTAIDDTNTIITVTEICVNSNEANVKWLKENTEGWANFLASLKAYVDYGINLRKGAFDFLRKKQILENQDNK